MWVGDGGDGGEGMWLWLLLMVMLIMMLMLMMVAAVKQGHVMMVSSVAIVVGSGCDKSVVIGEMIVVIAIVRAGS